MFYIFALSSVRFRMQLKWVYGIGRDRMVA